MLFQIPITSYTVVNGVNYIRANAPCPFIGKYKIKLCQFTYYYSGAVNPVPIQIISKTLINPVGNSALALSTNPSFSVVYTLDKYAFESTLNGFIDIDVRMFTLSAGGAGNPAVGDYNVPTNFGFCLFTFDIEPVSDNKLF